MKTFRFYETDIPANTRHEFLSSKEFKEDLVHQNVRKGKLLAKIVITLEAILISIDIISYLLKVNDEFSYFIYFTMYLLMISANLVYICLINSYQRGWIRANTMYAFNILYITIIMAWGGVVSLMDQKLYAQTMVFMVNMIICSVLFSLDKKSMSIPYLISTIPFIIALPFFQSSGNVLIGHYANMSIYITISWTISRIMYRSYCDNYISNKLLHQTNSLLKNEIEKNSTINTQLSIANAQLTELALVDDLTKLPNRRGLHAFLDNRALDNFQEQMVSIIMIDIDYFKLYNDFYGHQYGDNVLINVANCLRNIISNADSIAVRWGGEEFIYATFSTNQIATISTAHIIRQMVLDLKIPNHGLTTNPYLTISLGTCTSNIVSVSEIANVIRKADEALYKAKRNGRNCVSTCPPDEASLDEVT